VAISDPGAGPSDPTRGTGADKITEAQSPGLDSPPTSPGAEPSGSGMPDPARGGCLKMGWGCLPVLLGFLLIPTGLLF
jgi:hypothetical protein